MSEEMTFRAVNDLVHFVHRTDTSTIVTVCGMTTSYLDHELSDSWNDPPTCFRCIVDNVRHRRPPFEPGDPRYRKDL